MKPSYSYYARNITLAKYPDLWKGLVFAQAPLLGRTGLTVPGIGPTVKKGTLHNMSIADSWEITRAGLGLKINGNDDYMSIPDADQRFKSLEKTLIVQLIINPGWSNDNHLFDCKPSDVTPSGWRLSFWTNQVRYLGSGSTAGRLDFPWAVGELMTIALTARHLEKRADIWKNGTWYDYAEDVDQTNPNQNDLLVGKKLTDPERHIFATVHYWAYYDRILSPEEIRFASVNPVKTFELRDFIYAKTPISQLLKIINETWQIEESVVRRGRILKIIDETLEWSESVVSKLIRVVNLYKSAVSVLTPNKKVVNATSEKSIVSKALKQIISLTGEKSVINRTARKVIKWIG